MKRTVVFKVKEFPTYSETFVVHNIIAAIKEGFNVEIITNILHNQNNSSQPDIIEKFGLIARARKYSEPKIKFIRYLKSLIYLFNPIIFNAAFKYFQLKGKKSLSYIFELAFYYRYRSAKKIHVHFSDAIEPLFNLKAINYLKGDIIVTFHGYDAHFLPKERKLLEFLDDFAQYVQSVTVNSEYLKSILLDSGFKKNSIHIIPMGVSCSFYQNKNEKSISKNAVIKLISVGRLIPLKGHEYGIRAIRILADKGYSVEYTIIGKGAEEDRLNKLTSELNLSGHVNFLGAQDQLRIKESLESHHIFLMTSVYDGKRREAFGIATLEAQAMGLPVVAFDSGGVAETIIDSKTGYLVGEKDIEGMVVCIENLINDDQLYRKMSISAINNVENNFDIMHTSEKFNSLYSS
ncbi:MAG: colanic acid biosynthesis glycosyltransferase WcaL [Flavobacterium sp.]|nr:MAG: colanic acid biosynthesis glycosyltransferase WcaL [Flavobacterium sp.]